MLDIWEFAYRVISHWVALIFGVFLPMVGLYERFKKNVVSWRPTIFISIGICFLLSAFFFAWRDEYREKLILQDKWADIENCQITDPLSLNTAPIPDITSWEKSGLFVYGQRTLKSQRPELPYTQEVLIKTTEIIQPTAILIQYAGKLFKPYNVAWTFAEQAGGLIVSNTKACIVRGNPNSYLITFREAFSPNLPLILRIFSKSEIRVIGIKRTTYQWK